MCVIPKRTLPLYTHSLRIHVSQNHTADCANQPMSRTHACKTVEALLQTIRSNRCFNKSQTEELLHSWRKRRGSVQHLQNLLASRRSVRVPVPDFRSPADFAPRWSTGSRRDAPVPSRYRQRARRLTPVQEASVRSLATTKSLRSLAADFGVSHETVRRVILDADSGVV